MSSVGSSSATDGSLRNDVSDDALLWVKRLSSSIGLKIVQEVKDMLAGLLGPPTVVMANVLAHSLTANTSGINSEWNDAIVGKNVLEVLDRLQQVESFARSGSLISVLVVCSQVIDSALGRCNKNMLVTR